MGKRTKTVEPTPGPWETRRGNADHAAVYVAGTNHNVAIGMREADAAYIVHAVNVYPALLACAAALREIAEYDTGQVEEGRGLVWRLQAKARAAIVRVECRKVSR